METENSNGRLVTELNLADKPITVEQMRFILTGYSAAAEAESCVCVVCMEPDSHDQNRLVLRFRPSKTTAGAASRA